MSLTNAQDWIDEFSGMHSIWYVKRLSGNDTRANDSHQAGPYIPKPLLFHVFPSLCRPETLNSDVWFDLYIDSHSDHRCVRAVWYNNRLHGKSRNECRVTNLGGATSALLDPESTGALTVFAFLQDDEHDITACHVWICRNEVEEDAFEELLGPVEPGRNGWRVWASDLRVQHSVLKSVSRRRANCQLEVQDMPRRWLIDFPSVRDIFSKSLELRPAANLDVDSRLVKRIECETEIFQSVEKAMIASVIASGFESSEDFVSLAQTILQRRKARAGRSLELHVKEILLEENLIEGVHFSFQPKSETGKRPDFLFPSEAAYKNESISDNMLRMLAVKRTCKDRWRQILNEADRIISKHLLTIDSGISRRQFHEMTMANVNLVVPAPLHSDFHVSIRPHLQTLESFIADIRLLTI